MTSAGEGWGVPRAIELAPGERLIWCGGSSWRAIASRVFRVRIVAAYFAALMLADMAAARLQHLGSMGALRAAVPGVLTGASALMILAGFAWATGRTTRYTVTTHRVVLQFGLAIPATLTLPMHRIAGASIRVHGDNTGDIALRLWPGERVGFLKLWPHARPWRLNAPEPMLRGVPQAAVVAAPLCRALAIAAETRRELARKPLLTSLDGVVRREYQRVMPVNGCTAMFGRGWRRGIGNGASGNVTASFDGNVSAP